MFDAIIKHVHAYNKRKEAANPTMLSECGGNEGFELRYKFYK